VPTPSFVAVSKFRVANGLSREVRDAFKARPHLVDSAPGFVRMDVLSPTKDDDEFWLITYWADEGSFRDWHHSHIYRESHAGIPAGLKLDPEVTQVMTFSYVSD